MDEGAEALLQGLEGSSISVEDSSSNVSRTATCTCEGDIDFPGNTCAIAGLRVTGVLCGAWWLV